MKLPLAHSLPNASLKRGFTIVELMIVVALIGVLATLAVPEVSKLRDKAGKVVCVGHLRSLHCSLGAYLNDNEQWPQCPEDQDQSDEDQFWIDTLLDYGAPESVWKCPSLSHRLSNDTTSDAHKIHYTPATFSGESPLIPRLWPSQPWLIELADAHGNGQLYIRTDGAVWTMNQAVQEAQGGN